MAAARPGRDLLDDDEKRRSPMVAILGGVAAILALAIVVLGVLFIAGFFNRTPTQTTVAAAPTGAPQPLAPAQFPAPTTTDVARTSINATPSDQGPPVRSTYGDWQIRCDTPSGASSEQCVLMQFVTAEDRDNVGLTVIVLKTADKQSRILRILAPLGVLLPSGLGLRIDQNDFGRAMFVRCLPNGCVAEVIFDDKLLQSMSTGKTATFVIFQTPEEGIGIPISLNGFQAGFAALP